MRVSQYQSSSVQTQEPKIWFRFRFHARHQSSSCTMARKRPYDNEQMGSDSVKDRHPGHPRPHQAMPNNPHKGRLAPEPSDSERILG